MDWRVLPYQTADPSWNMAVDEAVFTCYLKGESPPTLRFYGWSPATVSIGYFQDVEREINLEALQQKGFGLVRRNTGGRAVLHDRELTYSVVSGTKEGLPTNLTESYLYISKVFADTLKGLGVDARLNQGAGKQSLTGACFEAPSWYEITANGKKLIGSAQFRYKCSFLQHGSILLSFSAPDLVSVLKTPAKTDDDLIKKLKAKIGSLEEFGVKPEPTELASLIVKSFEKLNGIKFVPGSLSKDETELAHLLVEHKYASDSWNYQRGKTSSQMRINWIQARDVCSREILHR